MPKATNARVRRGDVVLMVGTMKGAFLFASDEKRASWRRGGPYFSGQAVYAMALDQRRDRRRVWAAPQSMHWGAVLAHSDDFGKRWSVPEAANVKFPKGTDAALKNIWQIALGRDDDPERLYCGVEPAALFESNDGGETWALVKGLWNHPHRPKWQPGGGGLCLHTVIPDASVKRRIYIAISTGGVYRTDDGGKSWATAHKGVRAEFLPDKHPEFGQCVHKIAQHPAKPERLYLQNHWGLYRTDNGGASWTDIANGVPSDFGFPIAVHPHDPDGAYIVPLESDMFRCPPGGKLRVYRTKDAGASWRALTKGLPQRDAYETILRDALATDSCDDAGVYFGTRNGNVYASRDEGKSWSLIADKLPPVVCVKTAVVEG